MNIQIAKPEHLNSIMQVINDARNSMRANGNHTQWINGYPSEEVILNDIKHSIHLLERYRNGRLFYFFKR